MIARRCWQQKNPRALRPGKDCAALTLRRDIGTDEGFDVALDIFHGFEL